MAGEFYCPEHGQMREDMGILKAQLKEATKEIKEAREEIKKAVESLHENSFTNRMGRTLVWMLGIAGGAGIIEVTKHLLGHGGVK